MASRQRAWRWIVVACVLVVAVQGALLAALTQRDDAGSPHRVPIVIAAPAVVAEKLAAEADSMPGAPFDAEWTDDEREARERVRDGGAIAAVLVDLRTTRDVVVVSARAEPSLNDAVVGHLASVEKARERTIEVQRIGETHADAAARGRWYVVLCGLVGFGFVLVVSLVRGPVAPTLGRGVARLGGLAVVSLAGAAVLQALPATSLGGDPVVVVGVGAAYAFTLGAITLAVETLAGLVGLAATAAVYFVFATPVLSATSRYLLPEPWPRVAPWMPIGAAHDAVANVAYFSPGRAVPQLLVIAAAALLAVTALLLARELRGAVPGRGRGERVMSVRHWRAWVVGALVPLAVLLGGGIALVPSDRVAARALPSVASETTCVDEAGRPGSVRDLNRQIRQLQGSPAFQGADVGADVQLHDGRFLLVFGDTIRGADFDGPRLARNSMMLWDTDCVSVVLPPSKGALIPDRLDGVGYWPMSSAVAHRPGYDLVMVSTQRVRTTGGGSFDFANLGPSLAVFIVPDGETPQLIATEDLGPDSDDTSRPTWGAALAVEDGWLYAYGTANPGTPGVFGFSLRVARVRPGDALDSSQWRYWDGDGWRRDAAASVELLPAAGGVSQTLSVFRQGGRWYALSKRDGDLGDQLVIWTAPGPTGPFMPTDPVASLPSDPATGAVTYMPLAHPRILPEDGTVVVSYSRNNTDFQKVEDDPRLYRPRFLRVPLPD